VTLDLAPQLQERAISVLIGQRIRTRRERIGMTLKELAKAMGLSYPQIIRFETGANQIKASQLWYMSRALGCRVEDLMP